MNSAQQLSYYQRMDQIQNAVKHDPVLLALHEATVSPYTGQKWSDILYPSYATVPHKNTVIENAPHNTVEAQTSSRK